MARGFMEINGLPKNAKLNVLLRALPEDLEIKRFLDYLKVHGLITKRKRGQRPSQRSLNSYKDRLHRFKYYAGKDWKEITNESVYDYTAWLFDKGYSQRSIGQDLYCLQNFYNYMILIGKYGDKTKVDGLGRFIDNPCVGVPKPKGEDDEPELLTDEEFDRLLIAAKNSTYPMRNMIYLRILRETWLRISQVLEIDYSLIDFEKGCIRFNENRQAEKKMRVAPLSNETLEMIKTYMLRSMRLGNGETKLFPFTRSYAERLLKILAKKAGITKRVHPHLFRHWGATEYWEETQDVVGLIELGGWSKDSQVWRRYLHPSDDKIVEIGRKYLNEKFGKTKSPFSQRQQQLY